MAIVKTPDGKYTYDSNDAAQVEAVVLLYEPTPQDKAKALLARAAEARGETPADSSSAPAKAESKAASKDSGNA